jgi:putative nucleotidyltransferase with HDIG domain
LLLSLHPPAWHQRHSRAVAEVAAWIALRIAERNPPSTIDRGLVEAAALLHDVDKTVSKRVRPAGTSHGTAGAAWLERQGHPELAHAVALHPVTRLAEPGGRQRLASASLEARVVAYADKRAQQRLVPMAERFARWDRRHPDGWTPAVRAEVWASAEALEREVCGLADCDPGDVRRLRWTGPAFAAARHAAGASRPR